MIVPSYLKLTTSRLLFAEGRVEIPKNSRALWSTIWIVGGLCWLEIGLVRLLWSWSSGGAPLTLGDANVTSTVCIASYGFLFVMSACAYHIGLARGWPQDPIKRVGVLSTHLGLASLLALLSVWVFYLSAAMVDAFWSGIAKDTTPWLPLRLNWKQWVWLLRFLAVPYLLGLIAVVLVSSHRKQMRESRLSAEIADLRLSALAAQLQPHFLFNALNAISELTSESPAQATVMVARLGDFLRIVLESPNRPWISVEAEAAGLDAYLALQQMRFRDRLHVSLSVDPTAMHTVIPGSLLQPIVENAIEHGLSCPAKTIEVTVTIGRILDRLAVAVTNSAPRLLEPLPSASFGNGLRNVSARLFAAYGGEGTLSVGPDPVSGTRAELSMPVMFADVG